jgi:hypothetical protein
LIAAPPSGVLTFCTNGKPHLQIERDFFEMLERVRRLAAKQAVAKFKESQEHGAADGG